MTQSKPCIKHQSTSVLHKPSIQPQLPFKLAFLSSIEIGPDHRTWLEVKRGIRIALDAFTPGRSLPNTMLQLVTRVQEIFVGPFEVAHVACAVVRNVETETGAATTTD